MDNYEHVAARLITPDCMFVYVTVFDGLVPVIDTHIGAIDIGTGSTLWTLPFPHNEVPLIPLQLYFVLSSRGDLLLTQRIFSPNDTMSCVEQWAVDINRTAVSVRWRVAECRRNLTNSGTLGYQYTKGKESSRLPVRSS